MAENERDTHFLGFANLLNEEIEAALENGMANSSFFVPDAISDDIKRIIAQRAYDLVYHASCHITESMTHWYADDMVSEIPDLTEWPDTTPHEIPDQPTHWLKPEERD